MSRRPEPPPAPCPACGTVNPAGFRFCGGCGSSLEQACPACGTVNPAGFRFCGGCGAALAPGRAPPPAPAELEERKVVTTLFADLAASTELASRMDPEDLRRVLTPFFEAMAEEITRFGGTVQKFIGDAVVAVFGVPAAHEDDPERAVRAALAMHRRLAAINPQLALDPGTPLAMRIGINTGEVVTATGIDREGLVTGEPVNVAARLQALAPPGGVVVGERTHRDTRHVIEYRPLGEVTVKGIDRPLAAWSAVRDRPPAERLGLAEAPLVGRESEIDLLRLVFARTRRDRRPNLVTVVATAGMGKSRLSREFAAMVVADHPETCVVRGRCLPYGDGLTYWPLAEILKANAGIMDSDPPEAILAKAAARLATRFAGEDGGAGVTRVLLSSAGIAVSPDPLSGAEPEVAKQMIARSWRRFFESIAAEQPVLAILEDLHWADPSLLDVIESLAARAAGPMLMLCLARPDLAERRPGWAGGLRSAITIELAPLSAQESRSLVEHLLGGGAAPPEAVGLILERAEGNPFFAGELLRMLTEDGSLVRRGERWVLDRPLPPVLPDTVQGVIASRIDMLPVEQKRAIQDAAVVGRIFWQGALQRLGSAREAIDALVDKSLVWERERSAIEGERELIFNHILTRDVAYGSIPRARRAQAHGQIGAWAEEVTAGRHEEFAEILAHHFEAAGDLERTARYSMLAGQRSRRVFAAREAIRWYDRACDAATALPAESGTRLVGEIALVRGEAYEQLGSFREAEDDYARALASAGGDALEARALAALAHIHWLQDRFEDGQRVLAEALEKARAVGAANLLARLLYTAGTISFGRGDYRQALAFHQQAVAEAEANGDREGEAFGRHGLCETRYFLGPYEQGLAEGLRARALLQDLGNRPMEYHNEYMVAWLLWLRGRLEEAELSFDASIAGARDVGDRRNEAFAIVGRSLVSVNRGQMGRALAEVRAGIAIGRDLQSPRLEMAARGFIFDLLADLGCDEEAQAELAAALEISDRIGGNFARPRLLAYRAWMAGRRGEAGAGAMMREALAQAGDCLSERIWCVHAELLAAEEAADPARLEAVAASLTALAEGETPAYLAWATYAAARGAELAGETGRAAELAETALALAERIMERRVIRRAAAAAARTLAALGREHDAAVRRRRAAEVVLADAASLDPETRAKFLARPDVDEVAAWAPHG